MCVRLFLNMFLDDLNRFLEYNVTRDKTFVLSYDIELQAAVTELFVGKAFIIFTKIIIIINALLRKDLLQIKIVV